MGSGQIVTKRERANKILSVLNANIAQIKNALPAHVTAERMLRVALTSFRRTPALLECTPASVLSCILQASALGLEVDNGLGHAYLIPFRDNKSGESVCTFIPGYRGLIDLAYRSGAVETIYAYEVREGDAWDYRLGLDPVLVHVPDPKGTHATDDSKITHAYAVATRHGSSRANFEVMTRGQIDRIRSRSKASKSGPWVSDYNMMARKTAIRRLFRYLPTSVEMRRAVALDDAADRGRRQPIDPDLDVAAMLSGEVIPDIDGQEEDGEMAPIEAGGERDGED